MKQITKIFVMQQKNFMSLMIEMESLVIGLGNKSFRKGEDGAENFDKCSEAHKNIHLSFRAMHKVNGHSHDYAELKDVVGSKKRIVSYDEAESARRVIEITDLLSGKNIHLDTGKTWKQNKTDRDRFSKIKKNISELK
jgi:hypothetical protein